MAVQRFKLAVNNADIPLVSTKAQRAVFVPSLDSAPRTPRGFYGEESSRDSNTAQILYAENIMPVAEGVRSVGYEQLVAPSAATDFDAIFPVRDINEKTILYSPSHNKNYIYDAFAGLWTTTPLEDIITPTVFHASSDPATSSVTYAYVDGYTFICYSRLKDSTELVDLSIYTWDEFNKTLGTTSLLITNLPFDPGTIDGISSSNGFLLVWSGLEIAWARYGGVTTGFDFTLSLSSPSLGGRQIPEDIKAKITAVVALPGGFVIFTSKNAIAANYYAQSTISPWIFREIPNAGGVLSYEQVTVDSSLGALLAYTSAGMQRISLNSAEIQFPEVGDFFTGRTVERYSFDTHELVSGAVSANMFVKIASVGRRYLVVSYGYWPDTYSYALIYDLALKRWGKLRLEHVDCFHYSQTLSAVDATYSMMLDVTYTESLPLTYEEMTVTDGGVTQAQNAMAFLKNTGEIVLAAWQSDLRDTPDASVVVIGRVQISRSRNTQLNRVEAEGLKAGTIFVQPSYNGRTLEATQALTVIEQTGDYVAAGSMIDCKNFNVVIEGSFCLSSVVLEAGLTGSF